MSNFTTQTWTLRKDAVLQSLPNNRSRTYNRGTKTRLQFHKSPRFKIQSRLPHQFRLKEIPAKQQKNPSSNEPGARPQNDYSEEIQEMRKDASLFIMYDNYLLPTSADRQIRQVL
jgi:hypothetical protein